MNKKRSFWRVLGFLVLIGLVVFGVIQFLPIGGARTNPPVLSEPPWDSPQTRALAKRACFDCHSNETVWPWYANIAPVSWLLAMDANKGRSQLNFSEWSQGLPGRRGAFVGEEAADKILSGQMPLPQYLLLHPEANLSPTEKQQLMDGLKASLK